MSTNAMPPPPRLDSETDANATLDIFGITFEDVRRELEARLLAKRARCEREMALAAKANGERKILRGREGDGGEVKMMIHPASYHYWGQRLGYECWEDPQFCREYLRDNPAARVRTRTDRLTIVKPDVGNPKRQNPNAKTGVRGKRGRWAA